MDDKSLGMNEEAVSAVATDAGLAERMMDLVRGSNPTKEELIQQIVQLHIENAELTADNCGLVAELIESQAPQTEILTGTSITVAGTNYENYLPFYRTSDSLIWEQSPQERVVFRDDAHPDASAKLHIRTDTGQEYVAENSSEAPRYQKRGWNLSLLHPEFVAILNQPGSILTVSDAGGTIYPLSVEQTEGGAFLIYYDANVRMCGNED